MIMEMIKSGVGGSGVKPFSVSLQAYTNYYAYLWLGTLYDTGYTKFRIVSADNKVSEIIYCYNDGSEHNVTITTNPLDTTDKYLTNQTQYIRVRATSGGYGKAEIEFS